MRLNTSSEINNFSFKCESTDPIIVLWLLLMDTSPDCIVKETLDAMTQNQNFVLALISS